MDKIVLQAIGYFHCSQKNPMESPRQGSLAEGSEGVIQIDSRLPVECLQDLNGFSHVWVIYLFHKNENWKPLVRPPRKPDPKRGVFATRSPYRPNPVGISCVELSSVDLKKRQVGIKKHDLLDGTPILDIKPYLQYSDAMVGGREGWLDEIQTYKIDWSSSCRIRVEWLEKQLKIPLLGIINNQLETEPTNDTLKRVHFDQSLEVWVLCYRTWRFHFQVSENTVTIKALKSGYSKNELGLEEDPYGDKGVHREFISMESDR
ncbi:MAG: tRNA (N6-threonylcarbamoyladenosine(37)-N6)-methyltransferase TrmO [Pseudomonadota bacterium]